ncbi:hypothetical protein GCM10027290_24400 [Micromonospora sonneratiae]|uniref:SRPBCC family protein n=1 Tax=Micromonospora sonneratiae TaxID=1184706 RepID=A0ABW3YIX1_9ACTN
MRIADSTDIAAEPETVFAVWTDVQRWPEWTDSVRRVQRLDDGPFTVGSRARVEQPRLPTMVWQVTELDPGAGFVWTNTSGGVTAVAAHRIVPIGPGRVRVELSIEHSGLLAPLVRLSTASLTRRYLRMEADGLRRRCERAGPGSA